MRTTLYYDNAGALWISTGRRRMQLFPDGRVVVVRFLLTDGCLFLVAGTGGMSVEREPPNARNIGAPSPDDYYVEVRIVGEDITRYSICTTPETEVIVTVDPVTAKPRREVAVWSSFDGRIAQSAGESEEA